MSGTVVFNGAIGSCHCQGIVKTVFFQARIVRIIIHLFVTDLLNFYILSRVDTQTAAVYSVVSLRLCITKLILQILHNLFRERIYEVGSRFLFFR